MTPYSGSCDKVGPRLSSEMEVVLFHRELYIYIYIYEMSQSVSNHSFSTRLHKQNSTIES